MDDRIRVLLSVLREEAEADVVYLSRFVDGMQHLRVVVGGHPDVHLVEGAASPLAVTYCWRVAKGIIPEVIRDSASEPAVATLPGHTEGGIGGYVASPVYFPDGRLYGTICCVTSAAIPVTKPTALERAQTVASLVSPSLPKFEAERADAAHASAAVDEMLQGRALRTVFQPLVDMVEGTVVGYEALSRVGLDPVHGPDWWLEVADGLGLGLDLERAMVRSAAREIEGARFGLPVTINASPQLLVSDGFLRDLDIPGQPRVIIEITERAIVSDYEVLREALHVAKSLGHRVAVDDAGAGFAGFRHMLDLRPDIIKLDMSLARDVDRDESRQALTQALLAYSARMNTALVAEGIETAAERDTLVELGCRYGQGYLFARPAAAEVVQRGGWVGPPQVERGARREPRAAP